MLGPPVAWHGQGQEMDLFLVHLLQYPTHFSSEDFRTRSTEGP